MKKVNFRAVDDLTTPGEWLDKALAVPERYEGKKARPPLSRWAVTAAACCVTAAVVSAILLMIPGLRRTTVLTVYVTESAAEPTSSVYETLPSDNAATHPTETATQDATEPYGHPTPPYIPTEVIPTGDTPTAVTAETQNGTQPVTELPTEPAAPTFGATEGATEAAAIQPTLQTEQPTQADVTSAEDYVDTLIRSFYIPEGMAVYCKITDVSGIVMYGDPDVHSQQHLCEVIGRSKYQTTCSYSPKELGILPEKGCYLCTFYNIYEDICVVLLTEKVYLNN